MAKVSEGVVQVIGVDLGDRCSQVCVLDLDLEVLAESRVPTTAAALTRCFSGQPRSRVVLETGTHTSWIHDLLVKCGHEVIVAHARRLDAVTKNQRKSDKNDARILAELGRWPTKLISPVKVRPEELREDLALLRARDALVRARPLMINNVRGLAKAAGRRLPSCSTESFHKQTLDESLQPALGPMLRLLKQLTAEIRTYNKAIESLCAQRYPRTELLRQVKGVGALTALCFVLTIADPTRFKDGRAVGAYFGLVPRLNQSGKRDPELRTSKCGDRTMRTLLVQSAHYILGPFGVASDLRSFGERLAARGGKNAKKRAVVATARKLAVLLFALLRSGEVYEPLRHHKLAKAS